MSELASGVLKIKGKKGGTLRSPALAFRETPQDVCVPPETIGAYNLVEGARLEGATRNGKFGPELASVNTICGLPPAAFQRRPRFADLIAIDPYQRFDLAASGEICMRIMDLVTPLGKGSRALIVSPPKAGKTVLLEKIACAIRCCNPEVRIIILLVDERPEEVTHFRRTVEAEVLASSSDMSLQAHIELAELTLAHVRTELECGHDIVILADSLTRMGRAFNLKGSGTGRIMSGGVEAGALEIPRRFFGLARKIENGGSVTIVATVLKDTGSRMDELIFEEFKGTGNAEVVLDRSLAEARIFPAIDLAASGTRKEHKLYGEEDTRRLQKLRRALAGMKPQLAMEQMLRLMAKYPTNREFLDSIAL